MSTSVNPYEQSRSTTNRFVCSQRPKAYSSRSKSCATRKHHRIRPHMRHNASSKYASTAPPFSHPRPATQHQRSKPPHSILVKCKALFSSLRWKIHLLKFSFLLQLSRLRTWLFTKFRVQKLTRWWRIHILRRKPEPRRPLFPRGPSSYQAQQQAAMASRTESGGKGEEKKGKIRRLSQSTVKNLKKACSLNSERDELREEDRRAMKRLDELWRTREIDPAIQDWSR